MTTSEPQYANVEQPFGCEPPIVHCPICDQPLMDAEGGGATPCAHLAFIYIDAAGDYEYKSADFE